MTVLYFPYLIFGLALLLVLLERLLTRSRVLKTWIFFFHSWQGFLQVFLDRPTDWEVLPTSCEGRHQGVSSFFCKWAKTYFWLLTRTTSPGTLFTVGKADWLVNREKRLKDIKKWQTSCARRCNDNNLDNDLDDQSEAISDNNWQSWQYFKSLSNLCQISKTLFTHWLFNMDPRDACASKNGFHLIFSGFAWL